MQSSSAGFTISVCVPGWWNRQTHTLGKRALERTCGLSCAQRVLSRARSASRPNPAPGTTSIDLTRHPPLSYRTRACRAWADLCPPSARPLHGGRFLLRAEFKGRHTERPRLSGLSRGQGTQPPLRPSRPG